MDFSFKGYVELLAEFVFKMLFDLSGLGEIYKVVDIQAQVDRGLIGNDVSFKHAG